MAEWSAMSVWETNLVQDSRVRLWFKSRSNRTIVLWSAIPLCALAPLELSLNIAFLNIARQVATMRVGVL